MHYDYGQFDGKKPRKVKMVFNAPKEEKKLSKDILESGMNMVPYPSDKQKIKLRPAMEDGTIPGFPCRLIINGRSNSGKSSVVINMLTKPCMYGKNASGKHFYDEIYMFSPTAGVLDDLVKHLLDHTPLEKKNVYNEFDQSKLKEIMSVQKELVDEKNADKAPKVLIILDDIQTDQKFLKSKTCKELFLQGRHYNCSTFLCGQSWTQTPRMLRMQASHVFVFPCSDSEHEIIGKEFAPTKNKGGRAIMNEMLDYCLDKQYHFMFINMEHPIQSRYRHNLTEILKPNI